MNQKQEELFNYAYKNYANIILKIIKMYIKDNNECEDIQNLQGHYKEVVLLYYFWGYSIKEIASILYLKESTVKMRLGRARKKMHIEMEGKYDEYHD